MSSPNLIQAPTRLSESMLWQLQKNYFNSKGLAAWEGSVPFYVSSNAFIGEQYAQLVLAIMKDYPNQTKPWHILELGAGTAKFSFHCLTALKRLLKETNQSHQFCYLISDVVEANLIQAQQNPSLEPFIQSKEVDFVLLDNDDFDDLYLRHANKSYAALDSQTPLIVIGNYLMGCIRQDAFVLAQNQLHAVHWGIKSRYKNFDINSSLYLEELRFDYQHETVSKDYYQHTSLNNLLAHYQQQGIEQFLIPIGAIKLIDKLNALTNQRFILIAADRGINFEAQLSHYQTENKAPYDGCYSFLVNFAAIAHYIQSQGGQSLLSRLNNDFKVNMFIQGLSLDSLPSVQAYYQQHMERFSPAEYCYLFEEIANQAYRMQLKGLLSFLRLSQWDPNAYAAIHFRLCELYPSLDTLAQHNLLQQVVCVKQNLFQLASRQNGIHCNYLGVFQQLHGGEQEAQALYEQAIHLYPKQADPYHNLALIYDKRKDPSRALEYYQLAYQYDKKDKFVKRRIYQLSGKNWLVILPMMGRGIVALIGLLGLLYALLSYHR